MKLAVCLAGGGVKGADYLLTIKTKYELIIEKNKKGIDNYFSTC